MWSGQIAWSNHVDNVIDIFWSPTQPEYSTLDKPLRNRGSVHEDAKNGNWSGQYTHFRPHSMQVIAFQQHDRAPALSRRDVLQGAGAIGVATGLGASALPREAHAQDPARTLVIASPATPQSLDIEFDVSLGSIDALGALYEYMLAYEKMPDPKANGVLREDISVRTDRLNGLALRVRLAEKWEVSPDGLKATFMLRKGVESNWGNDLGVSKTWGTTPRVGVPSGRSVRPAPRP